MPKEKARIDDLLVTQGFCQDRNSATSLLLSGSVLVDDRVITKAGQIVSKNAIIRIRERIKKYVSRGAYKLLGAFEDFKIESLNGVDCWDWGSSTGGFSEVLLEKGAKSVTCVDVGYGQLAQRIANHPKVLVFDRLHIKDFEPEVKLLTDGKVFVTMDLSFLSLTVAFERIKQISERYPKLEISGVSLVKPQFEVSPEFLTKGVLLDHKKIGSILIKIVRKIRAQNEKFRLLGVSESPIQGADGNREFFFYWNLGIK